MIDLIPLTQLTLIIGGAKSGKSAFAEFIVANHAIHVGKFPIYLACSEVCDIEFSKRIFYHQVRRGCSWRTVEMPFDIVSFLDKQKEGAPILLDCLTVWLSNIILKNEENLLVSITSFLDSLITIQGPLVVVTNEIGCGIIPDNTLTRVFLDQVGSLNQKVAAISQRIFSVAFGTPVCIKN